MQISCITFEYWYKLLLISVITMNYNNYITNHFIKDLQKIEALK